MNLEIQTDLSVIPSVIEFNFEELKAEIQNSLVKYNNLVVTEAGIKEAKSDKAKLNKLITAIENERKKAKRLCLAPYNSFEEKCKELVMLIKAPTVKIDGQIKEFEEIKKQEKYSELQRFFDEESKGLSGVVTLEKIIDPKWGNSGMKISTLKEEITDELDRIKNDLSAINKQYENSPHKAAVTLEYCKKYDLGKTFVYAAQLEYEARMQAKKAAENTQKNTSENTQEIVPETSRTDEREITGTFKVICTKNQLIALRDFMKENQIQFEVVKG